MKLLLITTSCFLLFNSFAQAKVNHYEELIIERQVRSSFRVLMETWKEELYFDLYDLGQFYSKRDMVLEEFAQRMVNLQWKPSLSPEKILKFELLYRNFAVVYAVIQFEHKVNPTRVVKKLIVFPAILENKVWKFDLLQLIRTPYIGKYYPPEPEKKENKKTEGMVKTKKSKESQSSKESPKVKATN